MAKQQNTPEQVTNVIAASTDASIQVFEAFLGNIQGITDKIPTPAFKEIIESILTQDFEDKFDYDLNDDSEDVFDKFKTFSIQATGDDCQVDLELKVDYEVRRGRLINDISYSIEEMTVYNNDREEIILDSFQCKLIKDAVETQNFQA